MISQEAQQLLGQAQVYQQQVQGIMAQKEILNTQLMELEKAIEELDKTKEKEVYKISGPILLKTGKVEVKNDLKEKKEMINTRLKSLETSEKKVKEKMDILRQKLSKGPSAG